MVPMGGIEPPTRGSSDRRSTTELHRQTGALFDSLYCHPYRLASAYAATPISRRLHPTYADWCGLGESNSRLLVGNETRYHYAKSAYLVPHPGNDPGQHIGIGFTDRTASLAV